MRRLVCMLVCGGMAVWVVGATTAAGSNASGPASYHVTLEVSSSWQFSEPSGIAMGGSATASADVVATGTPGPNGAPPTTFTGQATLTWSNVQYTNNAPGCSATPAGNSGSFQVTLTTSGDTLNVTWSGDGTSDADEVCGSSSAVAPMTLPFRNLEPTTFTLPATGGTQNLSGTWAGVSRQDINQGTITVTRNSPCTNKASQVTDVSTPNGESTSLGSLKGTTLYPGQTISADQPVQLDLGDGSVMRLAKGDTIGIQGCNEGTGPETVRIRFSLLLGSIWAKVTKAVGGYQINTPGHATGVRGTIFWITNTATATILHVDTDSMWMAALKGTQVHGKKWIVTAGHTATWKQGATKPVIRRGGPATPPALAAFGTS